MFTIASLLWWHIGRYFEFLPRFRTGELLNLRSEKIDKLVVTKAIDESLESWSGATLVEWTCAESTLLYGDEESKC